MKTLPLRISTVTSPLERTAWAFRNWSWPAVLVGLLAWSPAVNAAEVTLPTPGEGVWTMRIEPLERAATEAPILPVPPAPVVEEPTALAVLDDGEDQAEPPRPPSRNDAGIEIRPGGSHLMIGGRTYAEVYRSIPFRRAEYLANPGYRHEATMEILFGQLRPTTVHKHYEPRVIENPPLSPYRPYLFAHWDYFQTHTLLRPRVYYPVYGAGCCY